MAAVIERGEFRQVQTGQDDNFALTSKAGNSVSK